MSTILFLKAIDRRDTHTGDMFGTHVETRTRKDGVTQQYHVGAAAPAPAAPLDPRLPKGRYGAVSEAKLKTPEEYLSAARTIYENRTGMFNAEHGYRTTATDEEVAEWSRKLKIARPGAESESRGVVQEADRRKELTEKLLAAAADALMKLDVRTDSNDRGSGGLKEAVRVSETAYNTVGSIAREMADSDAFFRAATKRLTERQAKPAKPKKSMADRLGLMTKSVVFLPRAR